MLFLFELLQIEHLDFSLETTNIHLALKSGDGAFDRFRYRYFEKFWSCLPQKNFSCKFVFLPMGTKPWLVLGTYQVMANPEFISETSKNEDLAGRIIITYKSKRNFKQSYPRTEMIVNELIIKMTW